MKGRGGKGKEKDDGEVGKERRKKWIDMVSIIDDHTMTPTPCKCHAEILTHDYEAAAIARQRWPVGRRAS